MEAISKISEEESITQKSILDLKQSISLEHDSHPRKSLSLSIEQESVVEVGEKYSAFYTIIREKSRNNFPIGRLENRNPIKLP